jgi:hypothetical protein
VEVDEPRRLVYTQLNLSVLAVPHQALVDACRDGRFRSGWLWVPPRGEADRALFRDLSCAHPENVHADPVRA